MSEQTASTRIELDSWTANQHAAAEVAGVAARRLVLLTRDLEPQVYGSTAFIDAVRALATSSRYASVRIIVQDSTRAVREGHRLIEVARRLSSFIELRNPHRQHRDFAETFLVADERALLFRKQAERYDGHADLDAPVEARRLLRVFDDIWSRASPDPEMRRLGI